jgi:hypothetical protein
MENLKNPIIAKDVEKVNDLVVETVKKHSKRNGRNLKLKSSFEKEKENSELKIKSKKIILNEITLLDSKASQLQIQMEKSYRIILEGFEKVKIDRKYFDRLNEALILYTNQLCENLIIEIRFLEIVLPKIKGNKEMESVYRILTRHLEMRIIIDSDTLQLFSVRLKRNGFDEAEFQSLINSTTLEILEKLNIQVKDLNAQLDS